MHVHIFCVQEAQRAAKFANKPVTAKQTETAAIMEKPKKLLLANIQTSGIKSDNFSVTGELLMLLYFFLNLAAFSEVTNIIFHNKSLFNHADDF